MAAGDKTDSLVAELGFRMEDPDEDYFTEALKLKALNDAQLKTAQLLDRKYLSTLEASDDDEQTANSLAFTALTSNPLNGGEGIIAVRDQSGGVPNEWLTKVSLKDRKRFANPLYTPSATNKVYWIFQEIIYTSDGNAADSSIYVYYMKEPTTMTTDVDPLLDDGLFDIILRFAEASLWGTDDKSANYTRRDAAYGEAMEYIEYLNLLAVMTRPYTKRIRG